MPRLLDVDEFCKDLEEVSTEQIMLKKFFHPQGLFSEQIFGPIKNYTCQCGTYYGYSKSGGTCSTCGIDIVKSIERRRRFAKITLPIPLVNPLYYDLLVYIGGKEVKDTINKLMINEKSFLYKDNGEFVVSTKPELKQKLKTVYERTEAIYKLVHDLSETMAEEGFEEWKLLYNSINSLIIHNVIVLPPDLRPLSLVSNKQMMDKVNKFYVQILTKKKIMRDTVADIIRDEKIYYNYFQQLQKDVTSLYTHILEKLSKKRGLIRGNILGKRIDFSGRAVITPEATISLDECYLPYLIVLELYKLPIAGLLIERGKFKLLNKAIDYVDKCIKFNSLSLFDLAKEVTKNEICILNRQPSLHRLSMLAFKINVAPEKVIKIHPLVCNPFNADFDGDQMAIYIPVTEEAKKEAQKMLITNNLSSPANENLSTLPSQDIVLGMYFLTSEKNNKKGVELFNSCFPSDYKKITGPVDKKKLISILTDVKNKYDNEVSKKVLDNVKRLGFKYSTLKGVTMSLDDFKVDQAMQIKSSIYKIQNIREQLTRLANDDITSCLKNNFRYAHVIESGARGSWDQVKQMILTRGFISNFDGEIIPKPIHSSLLDGLTEEEFFLSTYGCRKGLLDVALNTGVSGYLSRKLIFTCVNLELDYDLDDCGTTDYLPVYVKNKRKARMLVDRYHLLDNKLQEITKDNCLSFVGKTVLLRSPILCTSNKICKTCYGKLYNTVKSRFIGVIAAQTLGERGTQLVLRTFHTSGSAVIKGEQQDFQQKDIIGDLAAVSRLLHKFGNKDYVQIVDELFDIYNKDIYHVYFECVVAQLMWHGFQKWRLLKDRMKVKPTYLSIQSVPNRESWILATAFSSPRKSILQGILSSGKYIGVIDKILTGQKIS